MDEVDALYTFPERFAQLAPKLRRYLQMVFVKSKFNQAPLFLRGIYFTSSMEEGAALDEVLAKLRGVDLKSLERDGTGYRKERSVFLRDLFMKKVFVENGLVTREANTDRIKYRRRAWMFGTLGVMATLMLVGVIFGALAVKKPIQQLEQDWSAVTTLLNEKKQPHALDVVQFVPGQPPVVRVGDKIAENAGPIGEFITAEAGRGRQIDSGIYAPLKLFGTDPSKARDTAIRSIIQYNVVAPIIDTATKLLANTEPKSIPPEQATAAGLHTLAAAELVRIESLPPDTLPNLVPLAKYIDARSGKTGQASLEAFVISLDAKLGERNLKLPFDSAAGVLADRQAFAKQVEFAVAHLGTHWNTRLADDRNDADWALAFAVNDWSATLDKLRETLSIEKPIVDRGVYDDTAAAVRPQTDQLLAHRNSIRTALAGRPNANESKTLKATIEERLAAALTASTASLDVLAGNAKVDSDRARQVAALRQAFDARAAESRKSLERLAQSEVAIAAVGERKAFEIVTDHFDGLRTPAHLPAFPKDVEAAVALVGVEDEISSMLASTNGWPTSGSVKALFDDARRASESGVANLCAPAMRLASGLAWVASVPGSADGIRERVADATDETFRLRLPPFHADESADPQGPPFTQARMFSTAADALLFSPNQRLRVLFDEKTAVLDRPSLESVWKDRQSAFSSYRDAYRDFWLDLDFKEVGSTAFRFKKWDDYAAWQRDMQQLRTTSFDLQFEDWLRQRTERLSAAGIDAKAGDARVVALQAMRGLLEVSNQAKLDKILANWKRYFVADSRQAVRIVRGDPQFEPNMYSPLGLIDAAYYESFATEGVKLLAADAVRMDQQAVQQINSDLSAFPASLSWPATRVLTFDEVKSLSQRIAEMSKSVARSDRPAGELITFADAVIVLGGAGVPADDARRWTDRKPWIDFVSKTRAAQVTVSNASNELIGRLYTEAPSIRVMKDGKVELDVMQTTALDLKMDFGTSRYSLELLRPGDGGGFVRAFEPVQLSSGWPVAELMARGGAQYRPNADTVEVQLGFVNSTLKLPLRLKFSETVPNWTQ